MSLFVKLAALAATASVLACAAAWAHEPAAAPAASATALRGEAAKAGAVVDAFHAALKAGDTARAASLLDDGVLIYEVGGAERSKAEYAAHHLPADAAYAKTAEETLVRRQAQVSGDMAWIASQGETRSGTGAAKPSVRLTTETMILRKTAGAWRIVHVHWSSRAAPAPRP
jgi:ketosteroid isomerase-like protein